MRKLSDEQMAEVFEAYNPGYASASTATKRWIEEHVGAAVDRVLGMLVTQEQPPKAEPAQRFEVTPEAWERAFGNSSYMASDANRAKLNAAIAASAVTAPEQARAQAWTHDIACELWNQLPGACAEFTSLDLHEAGLRVFGTLAPVAPEQPPKAEVELPTREEIRQRLYEAHRYGMPAQGSAQSRLRPWSQVKQSPDFMAAMDREARYVLSLLRQHSRSDQAEEIARLRERAEKAEAEVAKLRAELESLRSEQDESDAWKLHDSWKLKAKAAESEVTKLRAELDNERAENEAYRTAADTDTRVLVERGEELDRLRAEAAKLRAELADALKFCSARLDAESEVAKLRAELDKSAAWERQLSELHDRLQTVVDEENGPHPTEPPSKLVTLIERALFDWRKRAADAEAEVAKLRAELAEEKKYLLSDDERRKLTGDALQAEAELAKLRAEHARLRGAARELFSACGNTAMLRDEGWGGTADAIDRMHSILEDAEPNGESREHGSNRLAALGEAVDAATKRDIADAKLAADVERLKAAAKIFYERAGLLDYGDTLEALSDIADDARDALEGK